MIAKNTVCLWYERDALEAARFYAATFPDSAVGAVHRAPGDYPSGKEGDVLTVRREDWDALGMEATPIAYLTRDEINALTGFLRYWRGAEIEGFDFTSPSPSITFEDYRT